MTKNPVRLLVVAGTRPEVIKLAPLVIAAKNDPDYLVYTVASGQHGSLANQAFDDFSLVPDENLHVMQENQRPIDVLANVSKLLTDVCERVQPDWVVVQGDTTTALSAAIVGTYFGARVIHVEAGLRSGNRRDPFPEECNRLGIAAFCDIHAAPTNQAKSNLFCEGHPDHSVIMTGNTVVDAVRLIRDSSLASDLPEINPERQLAVLTAHRRENFGEPHSNCFRGVAKLVEMNPQLDVIYPVHPNPAVFQNARECLGDLNQVHLIEPLSYRAMIQLMDRADILLTDSGGIQEEATVLNIPTLVLRETTERPESVEVGVSQVVGTNPQRIAEEAQKILNIASSQKANKLNQHGDISTPYGDGYASEKILDAIRSYIGNNA